MPAYTATRNEESLFFVGLRNPALGLTVRQNDCVLNNDRREIFNFF